MAEVKAGDLNLNFNQDWDTNYWTLISSNSADEIMNIICNANEDELAHYKDKADKYLNTDPEDTTTGIANHIGAVASTGTAAAAGGLTAATLGATTTSAGGLLGLFGVTTVVAAPLALVAGAGLGAAALGYGVYRLATNSAEREGKEKQCNKVAQDGRYNINPVRMLNPYVFSFEETGKYIYNSYQMLVAIPSRSEADDKEFLQLFSADRFKFDLEKLRVSFVNDVKAYYNKLQARYMRENQDVISKVAALMAINNEYIAARMDRIESIEQIVDVQKGDLAVNEAVIAREEAKAILAMFKLLLNHPLNTPAQREKQLEIAYDKAAEFELVQLLEEMLNDKRDIKLNEQNYLEYLGEVVDVLDEEHARIFIKVLAEKLSECMLIDSELEPYEQEILQGIVKKFKNLLGEIEQDSCLYKALNDEKYMKNLSLFSRFKQLLSDS